MAHIYAISISWLNANIDSYKGDRLSYWYKLYYHAYTLKNLGEFNGSRTFNMFSFCEIIPNLIWYCVLFYDFPLCGFWYCYQQGLDFLNYNQHQRSPDIRIPNCKFKTMGPHTLIKESKYLLIRYKILLPSVVKLY